MPYNPNMFDIDIPLNPSTISVYWLIPLVLFIILMVIFISRLFGRKNNDD